MQLRSQNQKGENIVGIINSVGWIYILFSFLSLAWISLVPWIELPHSRSLREKHFIVEIWRAVALVLPYWLRHNNLISNFMWVGWAGPIQSSHKNGNETRVSFVWSDTAPRPTQNIPLPTTSPKLHFLINSSSGTPKLNWMGQFEHPQ